MTLSEICKELEINCKSRVYENVTDLISAIETECVRVKDALNREIQAIPEDTII